jgi:hypothetical protein
VSSSRIPAVVDALVSLLDAALAIEVRDGEVLQNVEQYGLTVGADLDGSDFQWEQDWAGLGHSQRDEVFEVPCVLWGRSGDNTVSAVRTAVFGYFATVESTLRTDEDLGFDGSYNIRADVRPGRYSQPQTPDGVVCRIQFNVRVQARI